MVPALRILITLLVTASSLLAQQFDLGSVGFLAAGQGVAVSGGGSPTTLIAQDFEGTGYDNGETWTVDGGTPDPDYTAAPLDGSQSLRITSDATISKSPVFAAQSTPGFFFHWFKSGAANSHSVYMFIAHAASGNFEIRLNASEHPVLYVNGSAVATGSTFLDNFHYYFWIDYTANGDLKVYLSLTDTKPGSAELSTTTSGLGGVDYFYLMRADVGSPSSFNFVYDRVRVSTAPIGSAPP